MTPTISFVFGTRPEIIKLSPLIRLCNDREIDTSIIHTGQHYSDKLDSVFFEQLELSPPDHNLGVGSSSHGEQTGRMIVEIESLLKKRQPEIVLVQGDTNSVLAGSIATAKMEDIRLGHVEAGLRSFDRSMPEEMNRILADHSADYLFPPTENSREKLLSEGILQEKITVTGNTIVDAVKQNIKLAHSSSSVISDVGLENQFALLTAHRAENVDDRDKFVKLLNSVSIAATEFGFQVVLPIHPRAKERINKFNIDIPDCIRIIDPQSYLDFLVLEDEAEIVFTDSGGVQEECCILKTPCVTLRENTERPETVEVGANNVVGLEPTNVLEGTQEMLSVKNKWQNPFGDGTAAEQIISTLNVQ